ncbi:MAG: hypothetical protein H0V18_05920 [Pyrinomonadaceae bacterium]|nr:hypothetical protein [Pyrinomonadaceae bacterium]
MPRAEILSKQALNTLTQLHAELAGKIETNRKSGDKLRSQMVQVEAVMKMLDPDFNTRAISAKRRNTGNPWFKRGTLYRSAIDVLRRAGKPLTAREMMLAVLDGKTPEATRKQELHLQAAILAGLRDHEGKGVEQVGDAKPARWRIKVE